MSREFHYSPKNSVTTTEHCLCYKSQETSSFVILSGCSGGGKTTLLAELHRRGYAVIEELGQRIYPSYFELQVRWLYSFTRITYLSKLIGIHSLAAFLQLELFRV